MKRSTINFICYGTIVITTLILTGVLFNINILLSMLFAGLNILTIQTLIDEEREAIDLWIDKIYDRLF